MCRQIGQFLPPNLTTFYNVQAALPDWAIFPTHLTTFYHVRLEKKLAGLLLQTSINTIPFIWHTVCAVSTTITSATTTTITSTTTITTTTTTTASTTTTTIFQL